MAIIAFANIAAQAAFVDAALFMDVEYDPLIEQVESADDFTPGESLLVEITEPAEARKVVEVITADNPPHPLRHVPVGEVVVLETPEEFLRWLGADVPRVRKDSFVMKLFETVEDLAQSGYVFRIMDNGGLSADRYTFVTSEGDYIAMSGAPSHPQGISQWGEDIDPQVLADWEEEGSAVDLAIGDLPQRIAEHVLYRINEAWCDFLEAIERREPSAVAPTRERAEVNEGISTSAGKGIYAAGAGFCIRYDGDNAQDDPGPFLTAPGALRATLPQECCMTGPEYHSTVDVGRMVPDPEVAAKVAALEAKVDAQYEAERDARL